MFKPRADLSLMEYDNSNGRKYDQDKPRYELIPPEAIEALAKLYGEGAKKYEARNWEKGMSWSRIFGALMRHAWSWFRGESYDKETGSHHLINAAWNCIAGYVYEIRQIGEDDRPKQKEARENV